MTASNDTTQGDPMTGAETAVRGPWYRSLNRDQWYALLASNLGWLFDGYETYALILTVGVALHQLLPPAHYAEIPAYAGTVIGITLLGWGVGGLIGGVLADYIGRKRMMMLAILAYSLMTGLSAVSWDWFSFAALRFLVGVALGSEWATGTSMTAELWPDHARGKGAGLMQCGLGIGFFLASLIWLFVGTTGPDAWRYMYLIGILPGLATLWVRRSIPESALWERSAERRRAAQERRRAGAALHAHEHALTRFTLFDLFGHAEIRRRTVIAFLMSLTTTLAWWGISSWVPPYIGSVAAKNGLSPAQWASFAGMVYNVGAIAGYAGLGFLADAYGRKPVTILFFAMSLLLTPVLFLWTHTLGLLLLVTCVNGFFSLGQYSWMPTWLPELYPTRIRATGVAFVFNAPRFVAFLGPLIAGTLIVRFGGYGHAAVIVASIYVLGLLAAPFLPETRGTTLHAD
jgi:MFS family permease